VSCAGRRATPDVALDADPKSGVSVYDTTSYYGQSGWFTVGGTSASSPMWAGRSAVEGALVDAAYVYGSSIGFRDITSGNNGAPCLSGFDLCSGRGSWASSAPSPPPPSQPVLSFDTSAQTLTAGTASTAMRLKISQAPTGSLSVTLSSNSAQGTFSASSGGPWTPTGSVTIQAGQTTSPDFYYRDTTAGSPVLTAAASGATSGTQTETVQAGPLAVLTVTPSTATVTVGGTQPFAAAGADGYGNPVDVSGTAWTTDAPGTVSPGSGSSTTFTAGAEGSGTVTATLGSFSSDATVTVVGLTAPSGLTATTKGKHISVSWQGSGSGVTYSLYRGTASGQEGLYASGLTGTSVNDMNVSSGSTYWYYVTAVSGGIESTASNEDSATVK
jgi:hypothetical protein